MKKTALAKDTLRAIKNTRNRFLSIIIIIALGVGFFAGLKAASPDMKLTADSYFQGQNLMDIRLVSTMGFSEDDLEAIRQVDGVGGVMPAYFTDVFYDGENVQTTVRLHSLDLTKLNASADDPDFINRPVLKEGRFPEKSGECVIESEAINSAPGLELGNTITLRADDDNLLDTLETDTFKIVGIVDTPYYISFERGNTSIGNGTVDNFIIIPASDFKMSVYPEIYLTVDGAHELSTYSDEYEQAVSRVIDGIEAISDDRESIRYSEIVDEAEKLLIDARKKVKDGQNELDDAQQKLTDARDEINENELTLDEKELEFNNKMLESWQLINDGKRELTAGEKEYNRRYKEYLDAKAVADVEIPAARKELAEKEKELDDARRQLDEAKEQLDDAVLQLEAAKEAFRIGKQLLSSINANLDVLESLVNQYGNISLDDLLTLLDAVSPQSAQQLRDILNKYNISTSWTLSQAFNEFLSQREEINKRVEEAEAELNASAEQLEAAQAEWDENNQQVIDGQEQLKEAAALLDENEQQLKDAQTALMDAKKKLDSSSALLTQKEKQLKAAEADGKKQLDDARQQLNDAKNELNDAEKEFDKESQKAEAELDDARQQIADGEEELKELEVPTWYILDRSAIPGHSGYGENTNRIAAIAAVFPVFFFIVAALVCLTTMTRMVEEDRTQIGTLKALGYGKGQIIGKYLIYALSAGVIGSVLGLSVGFRLFPGVVIGAYKIMYSFPVKTLTPFHTGYAIVSVIAAIACTMFAAVAVCYKNLMSNPAKLMRPKAPKSGKRILLERITPVWKHMNFAQKVTARNLFRYKKRFMMTVIGIAGCTALLVTGFGLKHAIAGMIDKQFGEVTTYSLQMMLTDGVTPENKGEKLDFIENDSRITDSLLISYKSYTAGSEKSKLEANLFVPESIQAIKSMVNLRDRRSGKPFELTDDGVIVTEKFASTTGLGAGDELIIQKDESSEPVRVKITAVTENYLLHYIYMSPALYEKTFGESPEYSSLLVSLADISKEAEDEISEDLLTHDEVLGFMFTDAISSNFADIMKSLDAVIVILLISAGVLAFVVLYTLTNININERIREIATIKVLGFYDKEVSAYIYRENIMLTVIGILVGLIGGVFLENFVITTAEVEMVMFLRSVGVMSFVYSAVITALFSLIVNIVMHFHLKKVKMVESLKTVE